MLRYVMLRSSSLPQSASRDLRIETELLNSYLQSVKFAQIVYSTPWKVKIVDIEKIKRSHKCWIEKRVS